MTKTDNSIKKLERVFKEEENRLNGNQKEFYRGAYQKILESVERSNLSANIILGLNYPQYIPYIEPQREGGCGISSIRSKLLLDYGYLIKQDNIYELIRKIYYPEKEISFAENEVKKNGLSPGRLSELFYHLGKNIGKEFSVFMTRNGNKKQLDYLLKSKNHPIIHRKMHETGKGAHYEILIGMDDNFVYLYNSLEGVETSGFYKKSCKEFFNKWWSYNYGKNYEKWYIVATNPLILPKKLFRGRYM